MIEDENNIKHKQNIIIKYESEDTYIKEKEKEPEFKS